MLVPPFFVRATFPLPR